MFMTPWRLAGKEILHTAQVEEEGLPLRVKKIAPTYGEFAAFTQDEQDQHASRIIHWFLHLHLGFPLQSL